MAKFVWDSARLFVAGFNLSGYANRLSLSAELDEVESTDFDSGLSKESEAGLEQVTFSAGGQWDVLGTDAPDDALFTRIGTADVPLSLAWNRAEGSLAWAFLSTAFNYKTGDQVGTIAPYEFGGKNSSGRLVRGTLLRTATVSDTGNGTAYELGAVSSAQTIYAALHVFTCTGTSPQIAVKVQSASDQAFTSPNDRITFTTTGTNTSEWKTAAGPVTDTWWRVAATVSGTSPVIPFAVVVGFR